MDLDTYTRFALALMLVLGLIFLMAALLRRFGSGAGAAGGGRGARRRLGVVEGAVVDNRRRLVLVRRDDREHLLLIGGVTDLVVERDIVPPAMPEPPQEAPTPSFRTFLARGQQAGSS
ncbi:flagellar biosynthetic protein FliO [Rhodospira trueperi]|uniref:Flagellar protein FliO/FliZ n=1 Tax=Rhodospira trueperi TaxID=69960 RepID=A0A1G7AXE2_9PROT|nr:flagellar biosynthetic protein FliO [Rhodospira trueperi]SDE19463.1 flagellar protein FliO/FliZ [Rhodospira trueperi]